MRSLPVRPFPCFAVSPFEGVAADRCCPGEEMRKATDVNLGDAPNGPPDLLYGMQAIADFLGTKRSVAYHLAATKRIPTFKMGRTVCARRSKILAALDALNSSSHAS